LWLLLLLWFWLRLWLRFRLRLRLRLRLLWSRLSEDQLLFQQIPPLFETLQSLFHLESLEL
jgi:hypothetical protein